MAGCRICRQDMLAAQGCAVGTVHINGKVYQRIKAGDERDFDPYMKEGERCGDCGAMKGFWMRCRTLSGLRDADDKLRLRRCLL